MAGCKVLTGNEYMIRYNNVLNILMTVWCKEQGLIPQDELWYKVKQDQGAVLENESVKMSMYYGYHMRKETHTRRPDATIEYKEKKLIRLVEMSCPSENNIHDKMTEKGKK